MPKCDECDADVDGTCWCCGTAFCDEHQCDCGPSNGISFNTKYHGECPMCGLEIVLRYMPRKGEAIACMTCESILQTHMIVEDVHPDRKNEGYMEVTRVVSHRKAPQ